MILPVNAIDFYRSQASGLERSVTRLESLFQRLQWFRGLTAFPGLLFIGFGIFSEQAPWGTWQLGLVMMIAFLGIATWQENIRWRQELDRSRCNFFRRLIARNLRHWNDCPKLRSESATLPYCSPITDDLDFFGDRSLYRWLSLAATYGGAQRIAQWLTRWAEADVLAERQNAVRYLAQDRSWRFRFLDATHAFRMSDSGIESIKGWCEAESLFDRFPWLRAITWVSPMFAIIGSAMTISGMMSSNLALAGIGFSVFLLAVCINLVITVGWIGRVHDTFVSIGGSTRELSSLGALLRCIEQLDAPEPLLARLRGDLQGQNGWSTDAVGDLAFRMRFAGLQRNPLFFLPYVILQIVLLWDFRVLEWLDGWKLRYGDATHRWMDVVSQAEALISSATIADEHADWTYPEWFKGGDRGLDVLQLGHPLLPDSARVSNDVTIDDARPLLLVTGSNMAGKSTLLRALGVNIALSRLGSPVACRAWISANYDLASSIRVRDSLQDGVSFFMAELNRLKSVVDWAHEQQAERGIPMLVLLDEILQGTNSGERQIAVRSVMEHLVQMRCTVVASTHDLDMAKNRFIASMGQIVHFREYFETVDGQEVMRFDYKMRAGVTPTTNALKLLRMVGLPQGDHLHREDGLRAIE